MVTVDCSQNRRPGLALNPKPTGGDDTARLQAAIDYADSVASSTGTAPQIHLAGSYRISDTIRWGTPPIVGSGVGTGTRIYWDGATNVPAFSRDQDSTGGLSFGQMIDVQLRPGTAEPTYWIDTTERYVDKLFELRRVHFIGGSSGAIVMAGWVNCHWKDLRFDNVGGWAIKTTPTVDQNLSTFVVDAFTYDHNRSVDPGEGLMLVDNSAAASNLGTVVWRDGRIEVNASWTGRKAIFGIDFDATSQSRSVGWQLDGVTYQDVQGMTGDHCIIDRTRQSGTGGSESLVITNSRLQGLSGFGSGTWSGVEFPTLTTNIGTLSFNQSA